jgi:hypothetical protein
VDKDRNLLPWFLGDLSMAVVLALSVGCTDKTASSPVPPPTPKTTEASPAVVLAAAAAPAAAPAPIAAPAAAPAPAAASPLESSRPAQPPTPPIQSSGQIWQCTINGQKVFSNNPCGNKSSRLEVGPINTMDRAPMYQTARSYQPPPGYASGYAPEYAPGTAPDYASSGAQEQGDSSYPVWIGVPFAQRRLPVRAHRPYTHGHGIVPHKY